MVRQRARSIDRKLGPPALERRSFLRGTGALVAGGALLRGSSGCDPATVTLILAGIKLASAVFSLVEEIRGSFQMENPGDREASAEIISDLLSADGLGDVIDSFSCVVTLAANSGPMEVSWCSSLMAEAPGQHVVQAQEGGRDPIQSDVFDVEPA